MPSLYAGCVYSRPPRRYGAQGVDDLSAHALSNMKLTGLPLCESHDASRPIGTIVDEWQAQDGSKFVSFEVEDNDSTVSFVVVVSRGSHVTVP